MLWRGYPQPHPQPGPPGIFKVFNVAEALYSSVAGALPLLRTERVRQGGLDAQGPLKGRYVIPAYTLDRVGPCVS